MTRRLAVLLAVAAVSLLSVPAVHAGVLMDPQDAGFAPRVPLSAFARPASWFDPSRLRLASSFTVGSGFDGRTSALQVTRLSYAFRAPVTMSVSLGNTFGLDRARGGSAFFLEGLDLTWRPNASSLFRVEFHDVRSPHQLRGYGYGYGYGYRDPLTSPY